jgi:hypothetical protein
MPVVRTEVIPMNHHHQINKPEYAKPRDLRSRRGRFTLRLRGIVLALAMIGCFQYCTAQPPVPTSSPVGIDRAKLVDVYCFRIFSLLSHTTWMSNLPADRAEDPNELVLGVYKMPEIVPLLKRMEMISRGKPMDLVDKRTNKPWEMRVETFESIEQVQPVHVLVVGEEVTNQEFNELNAMQRNRNAVIIRLFGTAGRQAIDGHTIQLFVEGTKVRIQYNKADMRRRGLEFSAQFLAAMKPAEESDSTHSDTGNQDGKLNGSGGKQ